MVSVLFVCHGNICRSPMAEFVMKHLVSGNDIEVASCATSREEIGHDIYPPARDVLRRHGIPYEHRCARQLTSYDYEHFDMIFAADEWNMKNLMRMTDDDPLGKISLLMDEIGEHRGIDDPWYSGDFESTFDDIMKACTALAKRLGVPVNSS